MPIELTILGDVLRGIGIIYWLVALAALLAALLKPPGWKYKVAITGVVIVLFGFLPAKNWWEKLQEVLFAQEAWAHFKKLCAEKAGEKIFRTVQNAKSVLVTKPLPPANERDLYDQYWYGDPYSNATAWERRGVAAATTLTLNSRGPNGIQKGLPFVEIRNPSNTGLRYLKITRPESKDAAARVSEIESPTSRFGVEWEDISKPEDREHWVAGSRLRIVDLSDNSVVAERIGFFIESGFGSTAGQRRPWLHSRGPNTTCPPLLGGDYSDNWFVMKVLLHPEN